LAPPAGLEPAAFGLEGRMNETRPNRHFRPTDYALGTCRKRSPYAVSGLDNSVASADPSDKLRQVLTAPAGNAVPLLSEWSTPRLLKAACYASLGRQVSSIHKRPPADAPNLDGASGAPSHTRLEPRPVEGQDKPSESDPGLLLRVPGAAGPAAENRIQECSRLHHSLREACNGQSTVKRKPAILSHPGRRWFGEARRWLI